VSVTLAEPSREFLPGYAAALEAGWSPNTTRDVSGEQLAQIRTDPERFLRDLVDSSGTIDLGGGRIVPKLPSHIRWILDGEFCGSINFRFQRGTLDLPPYCSGHIGYSIVPWKRRRGYATEALRQVLAIARQEGFSRVLITCDPDNEGSIKVIETNGGVFSGRVPSPDKPGGDKLTFWVETP
jgi:predicted acetyltransferase